MNDRYFVGDIDTRQRFLWCSTRKAAIKNALRITEGNVKIIDTFASDYDKDSWWD